MDDQDQAPKSFTLVAWNVYQGLHYSSTRRQRLNNEHLVAKIVGLDADVLVMPEAWAYRQSGATWAEDLAAEIGYELHQWISEAPSRPRDVCPWRMAIFTRIAAVRLDDHVLSPLGSLGPRAVVRVHLADHDLVVSGAHFYGIHALRRGPHLWMRERRDLRDVAGQSDVLAGDFNIWGPVARRDIGDLRQAVSGRTFPSHRPHSQIDHIMVSDRVEVIDSAVLSNLGSDHLPVKATLRPR